MNTLQVVPSEVQVLQVGESGLHEMGREHVTAHRPCTSTCQEVSMLTTDNANQTPVTLREAAVIVGRSWNTVHGWTRTGMPFTRAEVQYLGDCGTILIDVAILLEWARARRLVNAPVVKEPRPARVRVVKEPRPTTGVHGHRRNTEAMIAEKLPGLLAAMQEGASMYDASVAVGIHPGTAKNWIKDRTIAAPALTAARAEAESRVEAEMRDGMDRFLTHYRSGAGSPASAIAAGFGRNQEKTWRHGTRFPQLAAWFSAEVAAIRPTPKAHVGKPPPRRGKVYFIQGGEDGPIKIGFTSGAVEKRLIALQCGSPLRLRVVHVVAADKLGEGWAHAHFAASRSHGEWFHPSKELLAFIKQGGLMLLAQPTIPDRTAQRVPRQYRVKEEVKREKAG